MKIGDKEYEIKCNAFTTVSYRRIFNRGIVQDVDVINRLAKQQAEIAQKIMSKAPDIDEETLMDEIANSLLKTDIADEFAEVITKVAWMLIYTADNKVKKYDEWLKDVPVFKFSDGWVAEVTEIAVTNFR